MGPSWSEWGRRGPKWSEWKGKVRVVRTQGLKWLVIIQRMQGIGTDVVQHGGKVRMVRTRGIADRSCPIGRWLSVVGPQFWLATSVK